MALVMHNVYLEHAVILMISPTLFQWGNKKAPLTMAKHWCGGILLPPVGFLAVGVKWQGGNGHCSAGVPFATCPSKEDKARLYNETQELWRMAGSLQCGCPPLRTHSWTWHEGDWSLWITSWEAMPRYSQSTSSLCRQWEPFGDAGLRCERSWIIEPKQTVLSCQLLVAQRAPWQKGGGRGTYCETSKAGNKCHLRLKQGVGKHLVGCT